MSDREQSATGLELLLEEPEIVAWLNDYRPVPVAAEDEDDEPPRAA
jgi:hypothetical protein